LHQVQLYGIHDTAAAQPVGLEYGWEEAGELKSWSAQVPAGGTERTFEIATGEQVTDRYIRMTVP
jgi:hypothetical protein